MSFDREQFDRAFVIDIGDVRSSSLDGPDSYSATFRVERDSTPIPNNLEVVMRNLGPDERASLAAQSANVVTVSAGYRDNPQIIFVGDVRRVESWKERHTWITRVSAGDGETKLESAMVNRSFAKGTPVLTVLKGLLSALGVGEGNIAAASGATFANGASSLESALLVNGSVANELRWFTAALGLEWSIQDGNFQVHAIGEPANSDGPLISAKTGLLEKIRVGQGKGKLKQFEQVVSFTALILPELIPGVAFRLESEVISGDFLAKRTVHYGDTAGQDWYVDCDGVPL